MDFLALAKKRYSVRGYSDKPIEETLLNEILDAGRYAPSACNNQHWHFIVIRDPEKRAALFDTYPKEWFTNAPVIIVVCVEPAKAWNRMDGKNYADVDGAIAMDHMTLSAASLGLGTCWIGAFNPPKLRELLQLPDGIEPLAMTPLGYPTAPPRNLGRKERSEIIHYEQW